MKGAWKYLAVLILVGCDRPAKHAVQVKVPSGGTVEIVQSDAASGKIIDLTHTFDEKTIYWPTENGFQFQRGNNGITAKGYYYAANRFTTAEHGGTHLDAPIHFAADHQTAAEVDLDRLMGEGAVIDVSDKCAADSDYLIGIADLHAWEQRTSRRLNDVIVLLKTGWSRHWPDRKKYLGTDARGPDAIAALRFPGLSVEAAKWLVTERKPKSIGIDTASIDRGRSTHFESHRVLCEHNVPIFENVASLDEVPTTGAKIIALPMKIAGGSGGPLRIVAVLGKGAGE